MKVAILALVAAVCLVQSTEAFWGWGGLYGGYGLWGGLYGGYGLWGKRSTGETEMPLRNPMNRTECMFDKLTNDIACSGPEELVTCQAEIIGEDDHDYIHFAIAECADDHPIAHWMVIPRKLDNSGFTLASINMEGDLLPISIWHSKDLDHSGLRINNKECFNKLNTLFMNSRRHEKVLLSTESGIESTAIVVADLGVSMEKRGARGQGWRPYELRPFESHRHRGGFNPQILRN